MRIKVGDNVLISPDLTMNKEWRKGRVVQMEENPFVGLVVSAETDDADVFFGRADMFRPLSEDACSQ